VVRARIGRADAVVEGSTETTAAAVDSALARALGPRRSTTRSCAPRPSAPGRPRAPEQGLPGDPAVLPVTLAYLAVRFEWRFGLAAVLATGHDILSTIAFIRYLTSR